MNLQLIVLETIASAVGLLRRLCFRHTMLRAGLEPAPACTSSTRLCQLGYRSDVSLQWIPEGIEPSSPGCKPGVFPLDDGPKLFFSVAGRIRTFIPGLRRAVLCPIELPQHMSCQWSRQDSNLQHLASEARASADWATEPTDLPFRSPRVDAPSRT